MKLKHKSRVTMPRRRRTYSRRPHLWSRPPRGIYYIVWQEGSRFRKLSTRTTKRAVAEAALNAFRRASRRQCHKLAVSACQRGALAKSFSLEPHLRAGATRAYGRLRTPQPRDPRVRLLREELHHDPRRGVARRRSIPTKNRATPNLLDSAHRSGRFVQSRASRCWTSPRNC